MLVRAGPEVLFDTPGAAVVTGLVSCMGGSSSDFAKFSLGKDFPAEIRSGEVPGGDPSIGLKPSSINLELKFECA